MNIALRAALGRRRTNTTRRAKFGAVDGDGLTDSVRSCSISDKHGALTPPDPGRALRMALTFWLIDEWTLLGGRNTLCFPPKSASPKSGQPESGVRTSAAIVRQI